MSKLSADQATVVTEQCSRIHAAVNNGTLDRATVDDALAKLGELVKETKEEPAHKPTAAETRAANR